MVQKSKNINKYKEISERIITELQRQLKIANSNGFVVNISGGIDSAVVLRLVKMALPNSKKLIALYLSADDNPFDIECIVKLGTKFGINYRVIDIKETINSVTQSQIKILGMCERQIQKRVIGNVAARIRMTYAYFYSNALNLIVIGTTNYSEYIIGYGTKFGDCASDFNPLINLQKQEVQELAVFLGIPDIIINRAPSAGLWSGQTDESELGFTYQQLSMYLLKQQLSPTIFNRIKNRINQNQHKAGGIEASLLK